MIKMIIKKILSILLIMFLLCSKAEAGEFTFLTFLSGTDIQASATMDVQDQEFSLMESPFYSPFIFHTENVENIVSLQYDGSEHDYYAAPWSIKLDFTVLLHNPVIGGGPPVSPISETGSVTIDYKPGSGVSYTDYSLWIKNPGRQKMELTINNVILNGLASIPEDIKFESSIKLDRYYYNLATPQMDYSLDIVSNNTATIYWQNVTGAEEYDLEWVFWPETSDYGYLPNGSYSASDMEEHIDELFNGATRVTISDTYYDIDLPYENGWIFYRCRAVGKRSSDWNQRKEWEWSENVIGSSFNNYFGVDDLVSSSPDMDKNWTYSATYSNDGKRVGSLNFFDGTGKLRQNVVLVNSDNTTIVSESVYDYEGRNAISTMATPSFDREMKFYENFNLNINNEVLNNRHFDDLNAISGETEMSNTTGAAYYYSSNNPLTSEGFNQFIPDADNYPFQQTVFDRQGRIKAQAGPGETFRLGNNHDSRFYYGTPLQEKLDRLFGNNVGNASYYTLLMSRDPNGQYALEYKDILGRKVATSLVGPVPIDEFGNPIVDDIFEGTPTELISYLDQLNELSLTEESYRINHSFLASTSGNYTFEYTLYPELYSLICADYDCSYNLKISVLDGNDELMPITSGSPTAGFDLNILVENINLTDLDPATSYTSGIFIVNLPDAGNYTIIKELTLNQSHLNNILDDYYDELTDPSSSCYIDPGTFLGELEDRIDPCACEWDCISYCECQATLEFDPVTQSAAWNTAYNNCASSEGCSSVSSGFGESANCDVLQNLFAVDLSPGGQYFDNLYEGKSPYTTDNVWLTTNLWADNGSEWIDAGFYDINSNLIETWDDLRTHWQFEWESKTFDNSISSKNNLLSFHPEFCHFDWCESIATSDEFDVELSQVNTFTDAISEGFITLSGSSVTVNLVSGTPIDPYFVSYSSDVVTMQSEITNFGSTNMTNQNATGFTLWNVVNQLAINNGFSSNGDEAWNYFKMLYLNIKRKIKDAQKDGIPCDYLQEINTPNDFITDGRSPITSEGFIIQVPEVFGGIDDFTDDIVISGGTNFTGLENWGNELSGEFSLCEQEASASFYVQNLAWIESTVDCPFRLVVDGLVITTQPIINSPGSIDPLLYEIQDCFSTYSTPENIASCIVYNINFTSANTTSDFIANNGNGTSDLIEITAPDGTGVIGNAYDITLVCSDINPPIIAEFDGWIPCANFEYVNCFCSELEVLAQYYTAGNGISENQFIANLYNYHYESEYDDFSEPITSSMIATWRTNCLSTISDDNGQTPVINELTDPLIPVEIQCETKDNPCDPDDPASIYSFYADYAYEQALEVAMDNFREQYISHCFRGSTFNEVFSMKFLEREHQFTLYYYDRAGNLLRTVPPEGVRPLNTPAELQAVKDFRVGAVASPTYPTHYMESNYEFNSYNTLAKKDVPDEDGETVYLYNKLGQLNFSENAKQRANNQFSYSTYDKLGRITSSGQIENTNNVTLTQTLVDNEAFPVLPLLVTSPAQFTDISLNHYNDPFIYIGLTPTPINTSNSKNRIVFTAYFQSGVDMVIPALSSPQVYSVFNPDQQSTYSYDLHGNVEKIEYFYKELGDGEIKSIDYEYDLFSGLQTKVSYQKNQLDQFIHKYEYDANNKLTHVYTSRDGYVWDNDATYHYYLHGPLSRIELGEKQVQGSDYAYTLSNQIKASNSTSLNSELDMGNDGSLVSNYFSTGPLVHQYFAKDAFGFSLGYFNGDYKDIAGLSQNDNFLASISSSDLINTSSGLYNGNINHSTVSILQPDGSYMPTLGYSYRYDQMNRLKRMYSYSSLDNDPLSPMFNTWLSSGYSPTAADNPYYVGLTYDKNGNIETLDRNAYGTDLYMDRLVFNYEDYATNRENNKLLYVNENPTTSAYYNTDIDFFEVGGIPYDQSNIATHTYAYDELGSLKSDASEEIDEIEWNAMGKVTKITRPSNSSKPNLEFGYDSHGNRIWKKSSPNGFQNLGAPSNVHTTFYIRGADGKLLAVFDREQVAIDQVTHNDDGNPMTLDYYTLERTPYFKDRIEFPIYGLSRIGVKNTNISYLAGDEYSFTTIIYPQYEGVYHQTYQIAPLSLLEGLEIKNNRLVGSRTYELYNHLGNVFTTISDNKIAKDNIFPGGKLDYFMPDVQMANDYYPFGMVMPGRSFTSESYRFGFNGLEKDGEVNGTENSYNTSFRNYDPRLGRWWSVDPASGLLTWETPYSFANNMPIIGSDSEGDFCIPCVVIAIAFFTAAPTVIQNKTAASGTPEYNNDLKEIAKYQKTHDIIVSAGFGGAAAPLATLPTIGAFTVPTATELLAMSGANQLRAYFASMITYIVSNPQASKEIGAFIGGLLIEDPTIDLCPECGGDEMGKILRGTVAKGFKSLYGVVRGNFLEGLAAATKFKKDGWKWLDDISSNFKHFDFWHAGSGTAVSYKTFDGTLTSFKSAVTKNIRQISNSADEIIINGKSSDIDNKVIEFLITPEFYEENQGVIKEMIEKAVEEGIELNVVTEVN